MRVLFVLCTVAEAVMKAEGHQSEIRTSFDDSSAPLLQHEDSENQLTAAGAVGFELE